MTTATYYVKECLEKRPCYLPVRVSVDFTTHPFEDQFVVLLSQFILTMDINRNPITKAEVDFHQDGFFAILKDRVYTICRLCELGMGYTIPQIFEGQREPILDRVKDKKSFINALLYLCYELFSICQLIREDIATYSVQASLIPVMDEMTHYAGEMMFLAELTESKGCH